MTAALSPFKIPEPELQFFRQFLETSEEDLKKIAEELLKLPPTINLDELSKSTAEQTGLKSTIVSPIINFLWRLAFVQRRFEMERDEFQTALKQNLDAFSEDLWSQQDRQNWQIKGDLVKQLLDPKNAVTYGAKSADLMMEQQLVYWSARIITDLRPVYDDTANAILGFLPFHTLVISYVQEDEIENIHIAMDSNDLKSLKEQIERAVKKENLIQTEFRSKELNIINTGKREG